MKAVLPLVPNTTPSAPPEASPPPEVIGDGETFASVLDRRSPAGKPLIENGDTTSAESASADPAATVLPIREEEIEVEETPGPLPMNMVGLPALPYHPAQMPRFFWNPSADAASPVEASEESSADAANAGISAAEKPAQSAAAISAGQGQILPMLTAMFPIPMAQLQAQLQGRNEPATREIAEPAAALESRSTTLPKPATVPPPVDVAPQSAVAAPGRTGVEIAAPWRGAPELPVAGVRIVPAVAPAPQREPGAVSATLADASGLAPESAPERAISTPTSHREFVRATTTPEGASPQRPEPVLPLPAVSDAPQATPVPTPVATRAAVEISLGESAAPPHGTSAAKRGEVMQAIAFPAPLKPRVAKSTGDPAVPLESVEPVIATGAGPSPASPTIQSVAPAKIAEAETGKTSEHRVAKGSRMESGDAAPAPVPASVGAHPDSGAPRSNDVPVAKGVDAATPKESAHQPGADQRMEIATGGPTHFPTTRPLADRVTTEAVTPEAPISRAEVVQIVERTADAAVRMRASGSERIEVAVELENGDRLSIQLRIANGEVTPYFRTSSEGLRTALEQNWTQFSDRANERGVRLTPPVFDVNQSSSNMTDLSQQRHGRDPAYTDAQAELFPHLPRRMRPPRVLASAPLESSSATTAGVRTYA